ncbi:MAG: heme ABC transporter ATP-binding protein [Pseudomonadota bacterium]
MLRASDIKVSIGDASILRDVSLDVRPGEIVAVIGPNGAGKSTLLHVLSGARSPNAGLASLDGLPVQRWRPHDLALRRAVLPQTPLLTFPFRVFDVVMLGRSCHAGRSRREDDIAIAQSALKEVDMVHLAERIYPTLSGGERQRVQLARVLAQVWRQSGVDGDAGDTRYILLDEPTNNLDIGHQQTIMETARRFADDGFGVLAILHDPNLAAIHADRICVLSEGALVADGPPSAVMTQDLLQSIFKLPVTVLQHPENGRPIFLPLSSTHH